MTRWISLALVTALWATPAAAARIDATVAAIGYDAIALSTLEAYQKAFAPGQKPAIALQRLIDDFLLAKEAGRYGQSVTNDDVRKEAAKTRIPGTLSEAEWQVVVANRLLARRFLRFRFGDFVPVSRDEVRAYYEAHRDRYSQPLEAVEEEIRALLVPVVRQRRVDAYKEELRLRYDVRINAFLLPSE